VDDPAGCRAEAGRDIMSLPEMVRYTQILLLLYSLSGEKSRDKSLEVEQVPANLPLEEEDMLSDSLSLRFRFRDVE
jgi:hypothetical protein